MKHKRMRHSKALFALVLSLGLAACSEESDISPSAVSPGEAQALDEAAAMLDEQRVPLDSIAPTIPDEIDEKTDDPADLTGDELPSSGQ